MQAQTVHGTVVDDVGRQPVAGAEVALTGAGLRAESRTATDSLGRFSLQAPRAGVYGVRVSHDSFVVFTEDSLSLGTGEVVTLEIRLGRSALPLQPLRVTARRTRLGLVGFDERRRAGFGQYLVREDIEARSASRVTDLLQAMTGLSLRPAGERRAGSIVLMSGGAGGRCEPTVWVDDVQMRQSDHGTIDQILSPGVVEAVEVYTSHAAAPPRYVTTPCGVILFWTRQGGDEGGGRFQWKKVLAGAGAAGLLIFLLVR
ncbi:MAG TPA: carboxypeptidase regulatory-like domain-containing protein [Longimicrobiales bacterium]